MPQLGLTTSGNVNLCSEHKLFCCESNCCCYFVDKASSVTNAVLRDHESYDSPNFLVMLVDAGMCSFMGNNVYLIQYDKSNLVPTKTK